VADNHFPTGEGQEVTPGDTAPDLTFQQSDGAPVRLSAFLDREYLLLVFLRHLV
jgi:peroxiredoxin